MPSRGHSMRAQLLLPSQKRSRSAVQRKTVSLCALALLTVGAAPVSRSEKATTNRPPTLSSLGLDQAHSNPSWHCIPSLRGPNSAVRDTLRQQLSNPTGYALAVHPTADTSASRRMKILYWADGKTGERLLKQVTASVDSISWEVHLLNR